LHPSSILTIVLLCALWVGLFVVRKGPLRVPAGAPGGFGGRTVSVGEQVVVAGCVTFLVVFVFTSVLSTVLTALGLAAAAILAHATLREPAPIEAPEGGDGGDTFAGFQSGTLRAGWGAIRDNAMSTFASLGGHGANAAHASASSLV